MLEVKHVSTNEDAHRFVVLPREIYAGYSNWTEPLHIEQRQFLDPSHPFYGQGARAQARFFIVTDGQRTVGRVGAIGRCFQSGAERDPIGHFGFFECFDSQPAADLLLNAAAEWLRSQGIRTMRGPASPSQNYEYGLLVEGYGEPHRFLLPYAPPYYQRLLSTYGLAPERDLFSFTCDLRSGEMKQKADADLQRFEKLSAGRLGSIRTRSLRWSHFSREMETIWQLLTGSFTEHWDYSMMSKEEFCLVGKKLRLLLDPDLIVIAEAKGEPVGVAIAIPDLNELIRPQYCKGAMSQLAELLVRRYSTRTRCIRLLALGVLRDKAVLSATPFVLAHLYRTALKKSYESLDAHWILDNNKEMLKIISRYGLIANRTYRIFRQDLI